MRYDDEYLYTVYNCMPVYKPKKHCNIEILGDIVNKRILYIEYTIIQYTKCSVDITK